MGRSWLLAVALVLPLAFVAATDQAAPRVELVAAPTAPPARMCGNTTPGPAAPPPGAVTVNAVDRDVVTKTAAHPAGTVFWLAPGTHTLGTSQYGQVIPKSGNTYLGAPGAVLDGKRVNRFAFVGRAENVTVKHLTVQGFVAPLNQGVVNHDSGDGWTIEANTVQLNDGAAVMAGQRQTVRGNCIRDNGQYAMNAFRGGAGPSALVFEGNEVVGNNTGRWDINSPGCGCSGGVKFWEVNGAEVRNNWVHHNWGAGLWADNNNNDFLIENNLIEANDGHGLFFEQSYNSVIRDNTFRDNAWGKGRGFADRNDPFPIGAIYVSESGGEPRLPARVDRLEITGNVFENNWDGIVAWENADRFCNSPANTGSDCTLALGADQNARCVQPDIASEPLYSDCRWKTKRLDIHHNTFRHDPAVVGGGCPAGFCGRQALFSNFGSYPDWSPYKARVIQEAITFGQDNQWRDNTYTGPWSYVAYEPSRVLTGEQWRAAPYNQDGAAVENLLDPATATLEGGLGKWAPWYAATPTSSAEAAHVGAAGLKVAVTANNGWGLQLSNWPGFPAAPGPHPLSYWAKAGTGAAGSTVTVNARFRGASGDLLVVPMTSPPLTQSWQRVTADATAPAGTTHLNMQVIGKQPAGQVVFFDDFVAGK